MILESERVLRSLYGFAKGEVIEAPHAFAGLSRLRVEDPLRLAEALDRAAAGFELADAPHMATSEAREGFATFDLRLVKAARRAGLATAREP